MPQRRAHPIVRSIAALWVLLLLLTACSGPEALVRELPLPAPELPDMGELYRSLELPDLSAIPGLPSLDDLPGLSVPEGGLAYAGPVEMLIGVGETIPGTDIRLLSLGEDGARIAIADWQALRQVGDSLDYDGPWPGMEGVSYSLRLRIYHRGSNGLRAAGVQRLVIENAAPTTTHATGPTASLSFPFVATVPVGGMIPGTTYSYRGEAQRGARLDGMGAAEYPFRKSGDSIVWQGGVRQDIPVRYDLRVLHYGPESLQLAGLVTLQLPE